MKSLLRCFLFVLLLSTLTTYAQNSNAGQVLTQFKCDLKIGDVYNVYSNYVVYYKLKKVKAGSITDIATDTLKQGTKFTVIDAKTFKEKDFVTDKLVDHIDVVIKTDDGRVRDVLNPSLVKTKCYKEGESSTPTKIYAFLEYILSWQESSFWTTFLISLVISLLYIYQMKRVDKLLYKLSKREKKIYSPGLYTFLASGIVGAITGLLLFFTGDLFKTFYMNAPVFAFPSNQSFFVQYYWAIQFAPIPFIAWGVFRNVKEFGTKFGLIRSVFLLIGSIAFFWMGVTIALIAVGLIVMMIMGSMAQTIGSKQKGNRTEYRREFGAEGERQVKVTVNEDGYVTHRQNVD